jgi:hypothetical protein
MVIWGNDLEGIILLRVRISDVGGSRRRDVTRSGCFDVSFMTSSTFLANISSDIWYLSDVFCVSTDLRKSGCVSVYRTYQSPPLDTIHRQFHPSPIVISLHFCVPSVSQVASVHDVSTPKFCTQFVLSQSQLRVHFRSISTSQFSLLER